MVACFLSFFFFGIKKYVKNNLHLALKFARGRDMYLFSEKKSFLDRETRKKLRDFINENNVQGQTDSCKIFGAQSRLLFLLSFECFSYWASLFEKSCSSCQTSEYFSWRSKTIFSRLFKTFIFLRDIPGYALVFAATRDTNRVSSNFVDIANEYMETSLYYYC